MSLCKDCISSVIHEGTPNGRFEQLGGVECYVATPAPTDYPKDKVVLLFTDIFGLPLVNSKLLADAFALNGFKTVVPDLYRGDPISDEEMNNPTFDLTGWLTKHTEHGFAVRGDMSDPKVKEGNEGAFKATVELFLKHL